MSRPVDLVGIAALLLIPSFDTVLKYTGLVGLAAYTVLGIIGIWLAIRYVVPLYVHLVGERSAIVAAIAIGFLLLVLIYVGYPLANSGRFGGGSDMDDALIIGAGAILHATYPYYLQTYLGGFISPLPGSLILSIPFVIVNGIEYQNLFWLGALFLVARKQLGSSVLSLGVVLTILVSGPTVYQVLVTGSDHIANTIFVLLPIWLLLSECDRGERSRAWVWISSAGFLGIALSSRSNFLLLVPLLFSALWQIGGVRKATWSTVTAIVTFLLVTLPFWVYDPGNFSPLVVQGAKVRSLEDTLPYASVILPATALAVSIALAMRKMRDVGRTFFLSAAAIQLVALVTTAGVYAIQAGHLTLFMGNAGYGMFTLIFAAVGLWTGTERQLPTS